MPRQFPSNRLNNKYTAKSKKRTLPARRKKPSPPKYARASTTTNTIRENRLVAKVMDRVAESKIVPIVEATEANGVPIQLGAQGYMYATVLGDVPSAWNTSYWNSMGSINVPTGVGHAQRVGNQIFLKKTSATLAIDCDARSDPIPMEFRTILAKPRRSRNPSGTTVDPYLNLFMNGNGTAIGPGTSGITNPQLFNSMINLRDFVVYSDSYDTMMGPAQANHQLTTVTTNFGPSAKGHFRKFFTMPHSVKAHFSQGGRIDNYDCSYFIIVLARALGQDTAAGRWNLWLQGTTSYSDS